MRFLQPRQSTSDSRRSSGKLIYSLRETLSLPFKKSSATIGSVFGISLKSPSVTLLLCFSDYYLFQLSGHFCPKQLTVNVFFFRHRELRNRQGVRYVAQGCLLIDCGHWGSNPEPLWLESNTLTTTLFCPFSSYNQDVSAMVVRGRCSTWSRYTGQMAMTSLAQPD